MALPNANVLGNSATTTAEFQAAIEEQRQFIEDLEFTDIGGTATANQVPDIGDLNGKIADLYSSPISNHIRAGNICLVNGVAAGQYLSLSWLDGTQRTVGKTGSGADQVWAYLSNLPLNAKAIICKVELFGVNTTSGNDISLKCHLGSGTGTLDGDASYSAVCDIYDGATNRSLSLAIIPLDSSQVFKYFTQDFDELPASPGFGRATLFYQGYITD